MRPEKETPAGGPWSPKDHGWQNTSTNSSHSQLEKLRLNRRAAVRERCLDCSGFSAKEVRECPLADCPLYPFRLPKSKQNPKARDKAIRAYCRECMNGQRKEVNLCPSSGCPLFPYRATNIKKAHIEPVFDEKIALEGGRPGGGHG